MKAAVISLGCSRNLVDSEVITGSLKKAGFKIADAEDGVEVCVINTCAFIAPAREESVDAILEALELKKQGRIKRLVVAGCLSQGYGAELVKRLRGIDLIIGTNDFHKIKELIGGLGRKTSKVEVTDRLDYIYDEDSPRYLLTPRHYAYIKISEGCSNFCSYCVISRLRGEFRSRSIESVVEEVNGLAEGGKLKEIDLVGQDTTLFGIDRYGKAKLLALLSRLSGLKDSVEWIRILYTHPAHYTDELISTIRREKKVCKYLDLPIQHASDKILKAMGRRTTKKEIVSLIKKLRKNIPNLVLRTSIIVGFPGETDREFNEVLDFMREVRFHRLGAFLYSKEPGTKAASLFGQVPEKVKRERLDELMKLQKDISLELNRSFIGKRVKVLIDEKTEDGFFLGRTQGDAPEVDGAVYVSGKGVRIGEFCDVKVTDALEYDLIGETK